MAYAAVFSGGGALGAWEAGCYRTLLAMHDGERPRCVTGASAGALNAAAICAQMTVDRIEQVWLDLRRSDVFEPKITRKAVGGALTKCLLQRSWDPLLAFAGEQNSILNTEPLARTLTSVFTGTQGAFLSSDIWFAISLTNLTNKVKEMFYKCPPGEVLPQSFQSANLIKEQPAVWRPVTGYKVLEQALMGTTALPLVFPPFQNYFDGGVLLNQPISPAIQIMDTILDPRNKNEAPLDIYVFIPDPESLGKTGGLPSISWTVLSTWLSQSLLSQITMVKWRNKIRSSSGQGPIRLCVVRPSRDFTADLLDFGKDVDTLIRQGKEDCLARFRMFDKQNENTWY